MEVTAMVRAKFYIQETTKLPGQTGGRVKLQAAGRGARNAEWASATPAGTIEMTINNPAAFEWYEELVEKSRPEPGRTSIPPEVFVTFEVARDGHPGDGHPFELADVPDGHYAKGLCAACGLAKDGRVTGYDYAEGKSIDQGPAHPND